MPPGGPPLDRAEPDRLTALAEGHRLVLEFLTAPSIALAATDAVLLLSIIQANAARISASPRLQTRYARIDSPPPAHLHQPVSVLAIADSLNLPFETTRRRIRRLAEAGLCEVSRTGCRVTPEVTTGPGYGVLAMQLWGMLDRYCAAMAATGVAPDSRPASRRFAGDRIPARLVGRTFGDYVLRSVASAIPRDGDIVDRLIVMTVHAAAGRSAGLRPRVSSALVARSIRADPETTRRRLEALRVDGVLARAGTEDWQVAEDAGPALEAAAEAHLVSVRRCLAMLERCGILQVASPPETDPFKGT